MIFDIIFLDVSRDLSQKIFKAYCPSIFASHGRLISHFTADTSKTMLENVPLLAIAKRTHCPACRCSNLCRLWMLSCLGFKQLSHETVWNTEIYPPCRWPYLHSMKPCLDLGRRTSPVQQKNLWSLAITSRHSSMGLYLRGKISFLIWNSFGWNIIKPFVGYPVLHTTLRQIFSFLPSTS